MTTQGSYKVYTNNQLIEDDHVQEETHELSSLLREIEQTTKQNDYEKHSPLE